MGQRLPSVGAQVLVPLPVEHRPAPLPVEHRTEPLPVEPAARSPEVRPRAEPPRPGAGILAGRLEPAARSPVVRPRAEPPRPVDCILAGRLRGERPSLAQRNLAGQHRERRPAEQPQVMAPTPAARSLVEPRLCWASAPHGSALAASPAPPQPVVRTPVARPFPESPAVVPLPSRGRGLSRCVHRRGSSACPSLAFKRQRHASHRQLQRDH